MMRKALILLCFLIVLLAAFFYYEERTLPVFQVTDQEIVLSKGYYGPVFIIAITYLQPELDQLIANPLLKNTLFAVDIPLIQRAPELVKLFKQHNRQVALLVDSEQDVLQQIKSYEQTFQQLPLWVMVTHSSEQHVQQQVQELAINFFVPSLTIAKPFPTKITGNHFAVLPLDKKNALQLDMLLSWLQTQKFLSIEESLFGYTISTKKYP